MTGTHNAAAHRLLPQRGRPWGSEPALTVAYAQVKKAAALANADTGVLSAELAAAITTAADEVIAGRHTSLLTADLLTGGGGIGLNMELNELLARRAAELLGRPVHPLDDVNACQSTNDTLPTALNLALHTELTAAAQAVDTLAESLHSWAAAHGGMVRTARTCLRDALPVTFGQTFRGYAQTVTRCGSDLHDSAAECLSMPLGATAVGTGVGAAPGFNEAVHRHLGEVTGLPVRAHSAPLAQLQHGDHLSVAATIRNAAVQLAKIAQDFRLLASGPRGGFGELVLPALQDGSSIMPGKVNPVVPETVIQIGFQVRGNDQAVTAAMAAADPDLNVWETVIAANLLDSCGLLTAAARLLTDRCVHGMRPDHLMEPERSLGLSAIVAAFYGHEAGARVAHLAAATGRTIEEAAVELNIADQATAHILFDPALLTSPVPDRTLLDRALDQLTERIRQHAQGAEQEIAAMLHDTPADGTAFALLHDLFGAAPGPRRTALAYACVIWAHSFEGMPAPTPNGRREETGLDILAEVARVRLRPHWIKDRYPTLLAAQELAALLANFDLSVWRGSDTRMT
ncbi:lyase family protein [Streptomyces ureilyticus]|uniref:Aspartate ammonia-lyase n=1 Tax=Streptomyces ureilyticus TaxID=1775131 RepID=A0ABX0DQV8_9ACTN|nr:lyase family protein [Streptomyces ureilyticus]NGO44278.1 aspartate ammonia-lyase [Streptomyces ureilyticus]